MLHVLAIIIELYRNKNKEILIPIDRDVIPQILNKLDNETLHNLIKARVESHMARETLPKRGITPECWDYDNEHTLYYTYRIVYIIGNLM